MDGRGIDLRAHSQLRMRAGFGDGAAEELQRHRMRHGRRAEQAQRHEREREFEIAPPQAQAPAPQSDESGSALSYRRSAKTELLIQTQDGDVVRLKIKSRDALELREERDEDSESFEAELRSSTRISFSVEGELDQAELDAIRRVMDQAVGLAEDFFAGDLEAAFEEAQALQIDPAELARVGLRMRLREELSFSQYGPRALAAAAPAATPAPATPTAPAPEVDPLAPAAEAVTVPAAAPLENAPAQAEPAAAASVSPFAAITAFLARMRENLQLAARSGQDADGAEPEAPAAPEVQGTLKLKIFQSVLLSVRAERPLEERTAQLPGLVSQTIDALDAHLRPPVDEVA